MAREVIQCAVMFADIVGSAALYEKHGNTIAKNAIENCLDLMIDVTTAKNGIVIKTIGDELMCRFATATDGIAAAVEIQKSLKMVTFRDNEITLKVHIGLHNGEAILENNDVFGNAVNVAARMVSIANSEQVITTQDTYNQLTGFLKNLCRKYDTTSVKGKTDLITIYDVLWDDEDEDVTTVFSSSANTLGDKQITLITKDQSRVFDKFNTPLSIGRGLATSLPVNSPFVSRIHAKIDYNRGKFVLTDQSTNGTYVKLSDGKEVFLRREALPLSSSGSISLGQKVDGCNTVIKFEIS